MYNFQDVVSLVSKQLNNLFIFDYNKEFSVIEKFSEVAVQRVKYSLEFGKNKYCTDSEGGNLPFNLFNSDQYAMFLYYLSNSLYKADEIRLAERVYYLNKALNGVELFYEIELPAIFQFGHPLGAVMGRADYSNYFGFSQGCTIGNNRNLYPVIGHHVLMYSNSKIIGKSMIGNYCLISSGTYIKDAIIPDNSIVFGSSPNLIIKNNEMKLIEQTMHYYWKQ